MAHGWSTWNRRPRARPGSGGTGGPGRRPGPLTLAVLCLLGLALGCAGGSLQVPRQHWTLMLYVAADNNLAPVVGSVLANLKASEADQGVTVVAQVGLPGVTRKRYWIRPQGLWTLEDLGDLNMASGGALQDFVAYGAATFPAEHYALVLWGHGDGWKGILNDVDHGVQDPLSHVTVAAAIHAAGVSLAILGADACNIGTLEAAYQYRNAAAILVGSQEYVQGNGWDYQDLLARMEADPDMAPEALAGQMVASYQAYVESPAYGFQDQTMAAMRLGPPMAGLGQAVGALADALGQQEADPQAEPAALAALTRARNQAQPVYQAFSPGTYVDLKDFCDQLPASAQAAQVTAALASDLIADYHGTSLPRASGLSIVFYDPPQALAFGVYDLNYAPYDPAAGTGSQLDFLNQFSWPEMMYTYIKAANPPG